MSTTSQEHCCWIWSHEQLVKLRYLMFLSENLFVTNEKRPACLRIQSFLSNAPIQVINVIQTSEYAELLGLASKPLASCSSRFASFPVISLELCWVTYCTYINIPWGTRRPSNQEALICGRWSLQTFICHWYRTMSIPSHTYIAYTFGTICTITKRLYVRVKHVHHTIEYLG